MTPEVELARLTGVEAAVFAAAFEALAAGRAYERFEIPKRGSKAPRAISAPIEVVKAAQRAVIPLIEPLALSSAVHGFRRGRSIVTGARAHLSAKAMINIDLADFFHSVNQLRVERILRESLVPRLVDETGELELAEALRVVKAVVRLTTAKVEGRVDFVLPQGAPTSPFLANLAARPLDQALLDLLRDTPGEYVYTRYADDLTISAPHELHRALLGELLKTIERRGFRANPKKVSIASTIAGSPHFRQKLMVTGLVLDPARDAVRIPRDRMDAYRAKLHQAALARALSEEDVRSIEGIVSFVHMVYGELPSSLAGPYARFAEAHGRPPLRPGKSRRHARRVAAMKESYR